MPSRETKITILMPTEAGEDENVIPFVAIVADVSRLRERIEMVRAITRQELPTQIKAACVKFWSDDVLYIEWLSELSDELREVIGEDKVSQLEDGSKVAVAGDLSDAIANDAARVEACMVEFWDSCFGVTCYSKYTNARYEGSRLIDFSEDLAALL